MLRLIIIAVVCTISIIPIASYFSHIITNDMLLIASSLGLSALVIPTILIYIWPAPTGRQHNAKQVVVDDGESINQSEELNDTTMGAITRRILCARRKRLFGSKPVFEHYAVVSEEDIANLEQELKCTLPESFKTWLLQAGYGDINDEFSLRKEWIRVIDRGELKGHVLFAQDDLGNFYSFSPENGNIHYVSRSAPEFSLVASDLGTFMEEFERKDFKLQDWVEGLKAKPYDWSA